jgi:hypothetical protein
LATKQLPKWFAFFAIEAQTPKQNIQITPKKTTTKNHETPHFGQFGGLLHAAWGKYNHIFHNLLFFILMTQI